jgi:hypothetical protein
MTESTVRGANGGNARAAKLSKEQRSNIAKQAAAKRWGKKDTASGAGYASIEPQTIITTFPDQPKEYVVVPYVAPAVPMQIASVPEQPAIYIPHPPAPTPPAPEPPKPPKSRRKPMVKEFGKAYSRAEKLLEEALKKRSEAVKIIIACNEDIPMYVNVIKSLGGTVDPQAMRSVDIRSLNGNGAIPNMTYQQPQYQPQAEQITAAPNNIDPALFQANSNPLPGLAPALANAPVVANKPLGGAIDLDFVPVDDEGPELPKMGGGWQ